MQTVPVGAGRTGAGIGPEDCPDPSPKGRGESWHAGGKTRKRGFFAVEWPPK
ncbi:hypothetical protein [Microbulbifer halophilus]|uniref:hypothetical protein n=1 Tax=Microbulbifer halophilus TaxID=453963 RepID=UPI00360C85B9